MNPPEQNYQQWLKPLAIICGVLLVLLGAYQIYLASHFRVSGTDPKMNHVAAVSPYIKIKFNRELSSKKISVTSSYSVVKSYHVEGKNLVVDLKSPMTADYKYWIKINYIADQKGDVLRDKTFNFTPKNIPFDELSEDQQQALLAVQRKRPPSANDIAFSGIDTLVNGGLTADQAEIIQRDFFNFAPKAKTVTIDKSSIVETPHNRNSASTFDTTTFTVKVGSQTYSAKIEYSYLGDVRLYLYDNTGALVFDSNNTSKD